MKQIKQETGRSMVEMLGVLAVIGVLSVGGISGYTLAMNKHRANSVAADLMKRAVVISAQRQLGQQNPNMDGFGNTVGEYELTLPISTDNANQTFGMTVQAVPEEVCEKILALDWDNATISPDTAEGCDGGDMTFTYNNDLSPVTGSGSTGGEGTDTPPEQNCEGAGNACQKCEDGAWVADTDKNSQSCDGGLCWNGQCRPCNGEIHDGYCCPVGTSYYEDSRQCCSESYYCVSGGQDLYCVETDEEGACVGWELCEEGQSSLGAIIGTPKAVGHCAGVEKYCEFTDAGGECLGIADCLAGKSTGMSIVGTPNATGSCNGENEIEVYCKMTDAQGECIDSWSCAQGKSTLNQIEGIPNATGNCADEGNEVFCWSTNAQGQCQVWKVCPAGKGVSASGANALGSCSGVTDGLYCDTANEDGGCLFWRKCAGEHTGARIIGFPYGEGACAGAGEELYCGETNEEGQCWSWSTCAEGKSTSATGPSAQGTCDL